MRPNFKQFAIINLVNNIPMAIIMSTVAPIMAKMPLNFGTVAVNVIFAFVLACIINLIVPVPLIAESFPKVFKLDPTSVPGRIVANIPICAIFVVIIGLILTWYNVRLVPIFIFAFLSTFIPLYIICFIVSMITNPIAIKLAFGR